MIIQLFLPIIQLFLYQLQHYNIVLLLSFRYVASVISCSRARNNWKSCAVPGLSCAVSPSSQLLTNNAFVRNDVCTKQVPLLLVIMSGRKKKDYRAVFQALTEILPVSPVVSRITVDFERAVWTVLRQVFPMTTTQRLFLPLDSSSMEKGIVFISSFCFS